MTDVRVYSPYRYLAAKKSVDDRAVNRRVLQTLQSLLSGAGPDPLRILEVGAGIGTMIERLVDWRVLSRATYVAVDADPDAVSEACRRLPQWADHCGYDLNIESGHKMSVRTTGQEILVEFETAELSDFMARQGTHRSWDLILANALLDLVDLPSTLPALCSGVQPGGLVYFTTNFDGVTILQPDIDPLLDPEIMSLYHETMDRRIVSGKPAGDSRTGRHLFDHLRTCGVQILDAGSSDWVVFPGPHGYPDDEAYFLHHIIHTIANALRGCPDVDGRRLAAWIAERHTQIERSTLVYIAHQLDLLGRVSGHTT
jgi:SAM-dependent methyltransferase